MMTNVRWPDNTCSVGETTIHFWTDDPKDFEWLFEMCPGGTFTPTFNNDVGCFGNFDNSKDLDMFLKKFNWYFLDNFGKSRRALGFYFNFKLDDRGWALLTALKLRGFPMVRGEGCF